MQNSKTEKTINIIGAGATGRSLASLGVQYYEALAAERPDLPPLSFRLIDDEGRAGTPYSTRDDVFILNQPAQDMSPRPDDKDHFTRWIGGDGNAFATRAAYGDYLQQTSVEDFRAAARKGLPARQEVVQAHGASFALRADSAAVRMADGRILEGDVLALAPGHAKSDFLSGLDGQPGYFSYPYTVTGVREALREDKAGAVGIVGAAQSMLDALAALDKIGYKGVIYTISRELVQPWPYYPEKHPGDKPPYQPHHLDPARVRAEAAFSAHALTDRLGREFARGRELGFEIDHVLTAIDMRGLSVAAPGDRVPEGMGALRKAWTQVYGNPTAPQRFALFQAYKARGQLRQLLGEIREEDIAQGPRGYVLRVQGLDKPLAVTALFNAAAFSRDPLAPALLRQASEQGHLRRAPSGTVAAGQQNHPRLFVAGPSTATAKWGIGTFREGTARAARQCVEKALGISINP